MFTQPQRLRRFAVHVLLVWLFALGTAFANACVIQEQLHESSHLTHGHAAASHAGADCRTGHDHSAHAGSAPCEQFLADRPAPNPAKQQNHASSDFWAVSAPAASIVFVPSPQPGGGINSERERPPPRIPIQIAFLRLTL